MAYVYYCVSQDGQCPQIRGKDLTLYLNQPGPLQTEVDQTATVGKYMTQGLTELKFDFWIG